MDIIDYSIIVNIFIQFRSKLVSMRVKHTRFKLLEVTNLGHTLIKNYPFSYSGLHYLFLFKISTFFNRPFFGEVSWKPERVRKEKQITAC